MTVLVVAMAAWCCQICLIYIKHQLVYSSISISISIRLSIRLFKYQNGHVYTYLFRVTSCDRRRRLSKYCRQSKCSDCLAELVGYGLWGLFYNHKDALQMTDI